MKLISKVVNLLIVLTCTIINLFAQIGSPLSSDRFKVLKHDGGKSCNCLPVQIYTEELEFSFLMKLSSRSSDQKVSAFNFNESYTLGMRFAYANSDWDFSLLSDLGYKYYVDSIWEITDDKLRLKLFRIMETGKKLNTTYHLSFSTVILNDYELHKDQEGRMTKVRAKSLLNPFNLDLAYGFSYRFWNFSFVNISLATLKIQRVPVYHRGDAEKTAGAYLSAWTFDYGLSINANIHRNFARKFKWINRTGFYINSGEGKDIYLDLNNQIKYSIYKGISVSLQTRINYNPHSRINFQLLREFRINLALLFS